MSLDVFNSEIQSVISQIKISPSPQVCGEEALGYVLYCN